MYLKANVEVTLDMRDEEPTAVAENRLYDALYEGLCLQADNHIEFWIENVVVEE